MKIAHVGPANLPILFPRGGAIERRIVSMASVQAVLGHEVTVFSAEPSTGASLHRGFRLQALACSRRGLLRTLEFLSKVGRIVRREPFDLIHFHSMPEGIWFTRKSGATRILSYDFFRLRRWEHRPLYDLYRRTLQSYDWLLPVSEFCKTTSQEFWRFKGDTMRVLHNGVDLDQFWPNRPAGAAMRKRLGLSQAHVVLYVGRVCEQKGTDVLLDAYDLLRRRMPDVQLVIAGPVEHFGAGGTSPLVRRIAEVGGSYLGAVEEADLGAIYNMATVYVMATRRDEMFGMAALEAQACGKPVVCSNQGGLPEVIPLTSGMHFSVGDAQQLATHLARLLENPVLCQQLAETAVANARRFSWPNIVAQCFGIVANRNRR
ncbi:MAG: glycosyltransferase family 4 protein [Acidobacteriota bacterium]|nr:glycosyltransferase family 4 protein [Acidobacteriota bacterium]